MSEKWLLAGDDGLTILPVKSILKITVKADGEVVSEGIEKGSFVSYNKTTAPLAISAILGFEGTDAEIQDILDTIRRLKEDVDTSGKPTIFSLVTPMIEYQNLTLKNYDYSHTREDGRGVLYVDANMAEIREITTAYSKYVVANPSNASTVNRGNVSASSVSASNSGAVQKSQQTSVLAGIIGGGS